MTGSTPLSPLRIRFPTRPGCTRPGSRSARRSTTRRRCAPSARPRGARDVGAARPPTPRPGAAGLSSDGHRLSLARSPRLAVWVRRLPADRPVVISSTIALAVELGEPGPLPPSGRGRGWRCGRPPRTRRSGCGRSRCTATPCRPAVLISSSTCAVWATPRAAVGSSMITSLAVRHHRLGHGHRLALATGQRLDRLADGPHGRDRGRPASAWPSSPSRSRRAGRGAAPRARGTCSGRCRGCRTAPGPGRWS